MQRRDLWKVIVFGIITLGIYDLFWIIRTRNEMVRKGAKIPSIFILFLPVLVLIVLITILAISGAFDTTTGSYDATVKGQSTIVETVAVVISMLAVVAILPLTIYWFYKYSKAVEAVTGGRVTFGFCFGMCMVLHIFSVGFIWPALVQDGFNKLAVPTPAPLSPYSAPPQTY